MKPYYQDKWVTQYCSDALTVLRGLEGGTVDLLVTDPPYGIGFMGKDWDKALPDIEVWKECLRALKPGAFAFVMSIPRADCLSRMIISLEDAGFNVGFSPVYWAYASGFPKAQNIGKAVDKRFGTEREVVGKKECGYQVSISKKRKEEGYRPNLTNATKEVDITTPATPQAKALDGSYGGFQPKPAVEVIIVAMKPLSEKTYVDQALKNGKGITWLDDCRVPYESEGTVASNPKLRVERGCKTETGDRVFCQGELGKKNTMVTNAQTGGRFPANLIVSDDVLNDGKDTKSGKDAVRRQEGMFIDHHLGGVGNLQVYHPDSGSFSHYFDLDKWAQKTFPFLIVPKASKSEKNKGLDTKGHQHNTGSRTYDDICASCGKKLVGDLPYRCVCQDKVTQKRITKGNYHPTVKPLKLMSYLITLGSRGGDTVLDPFLGSGTTALASKLLGRKCVGIEIEEKYCEIAAKRCSQDVMELKVGE